MQHRLHESRTTNLNSSDKTFTDQRQMRHGKAFGKKVAFPPRRDAVGSLSKRYHNSCTRACPCTCHTRHWIGTPTFFSSMLGQLFIDSSGIPMVRSKCNVPNCQGRSSSYLDIQYWLPQGVHWSQIVRFYCAFQAHFGPQLQLSTLRRIPDNAPAIAFAMSGNIPRLKDLFKRGLASPHDVCETRGYSLLRVSDLRIRNILQGSYLISSGHCTRDVTIPASSWCTRELTLTTGEYISSQSIVAYPLRSHV